ncbi:MAG TPA: hypothetical protein VGL38_05565 [bacterium]
MAFFLIAASPLLAETPFRICIYGDNRGANRVHRTILKQAKKLHPRLFVIDGDVVKYDYGRAGTPEAVLNDYRSVFAAPDHPLDFWPNAPGPAVFTTPGGDDEQYFLDPETAHRADQVPGKRCAYEGTNELGVQLYEMFDLDAMRIRVQPLTEIDKPLPMSDYGDYLLIVGSGSRRDCALLMLYRSDRWAFREDQIRWVDSTLTALRKASPALPLIAVAHDWTWFFPDTLDNGHIDGAENGVRGGSAEEDQKQRRRLAEALHTFRVDVAVSSDRHAYWAGKDGSLLRINCAAAICADPRGERVAVDNLWLEYSQTPSTIKVVVHPVDPPGGCGITSASSSAYGLAFEKDRAAGSAWRSTQP